MRKALNENPVVQAAFLGVLAIAVAFLLLTRVLGGGTDEAPPAPAVATGEAVAQFETELSPEAATTAMGTATEAIEAGDAQAAFDAIASAVMGDFEAGPGLPGKVVDAYSDGKAVAVLITRRRGIEDRHLRRMRSRIQSAGNVAVFHAYARDIARYSRITGGVDVSRVPALVVVRPRKQSGSGAPTATVNYGFRGPASAEQAVRDALYQGRRDIPYHPYPEKKKQQQR